MFAQDKDDGDEGFDEPEVKSSLPSEGKESTHVQDETLFTDDLEEDLDDLLLDDDEEEEEGA